MKPLLRTAAPQHERSSWMNRLAPKMKRGVLTLPLLLAAAWCLSSCASAVFSEHKKERLPDGTIHEYDEPLPFWMEAASVARLILVGEEKTNPRVERDMA